MEIHNAAKVSDSLPKSANTDSSAGANMTPERVLLLEFIIYERYERIAMAVRMKVARTFFDGTNFGGFQDLLCHPTSLLYFVRHSPRPIMVSFPICTQYF